MEDDFEQEDEGVGRWDQEGRKVFRERVAIPKMV